MHEITIPLDDSLDGSGPSLRIGRPVDAAGLLRFPLLVTAANGAWLAIGEAERRRSWSMSIVNHGPVPFGAAPVIKVAAENAIRSWLEHLDRERKAREWIDNRRAALGAAIQRRDAVNREIAEITASITDAEIARTDR